MKKLACLLLALLLLASVPAVDATPVLAKGSFAQYVRTTSSFSNVLNGTFQWMAQSVTGEPPVASVSVLNNQSSQITSFTFAIDLSSRIEIPSYTVASQNPSTTTPVVGTDHPTRTFFWIDLNPAIGSVIDTVLGSTIINGTTQLSLRSGVYSCWTSASQTSGNAGPGSNANATLQFWFDQKTGLLVKLESNVTSQFSKSSDIFLLQSTNIVSALSQSLTLTAVEWASLTMSIIALILGGLAVAVAMDLKQFRRKKPKLE